MRTPPPDIIIARKSDGRYVVYCFTCKRAVGGSQGTYAEAYSVLCDHEMREQDADND